MISLAHPGGAGVGHPIDVALAQLALTRGDNQRAEAVAGKALQASRRMDTPIFLGRALVQQAAARRRLGGHGEETRPLVDEALAIARRTGAELIAHEAVRYRLS
jgi:hypothetical protein